ncbi:LPXTG cell wall anchor domain-containing protein [Dyadobacter psychrotolerans]|uniref:LPXTG cell wall anchor domain-containing protein n=1 Tax=Dyadobacter psychrotolerans TaxID=2541721 RepID=A0A4R5DDM6_9BACT|nr:LPXTG cell wall anchor domain-containing protein [Dyadobacter psychrotolerans]
MINSLPSTGSTNFIVVVIVIIALLSFFLKTRALFVSNPLGFFDVKMLSIYSFLYELLTSKFLFEILLIK